MTPEPDEHSPPGWYDDPALPAARRYWDGTNWTAQTAPRQPSPVAPGPTPADSAPPVRSPQPAPPQPAPMARREAPKRLTPFSIAWRAIIRAIIVGALCFSFLGLLVLVHWLENTKSRVRFRYVILAPAMLILSVVVGVFAVRAGVPAVLAVPAVLVLTYALLTCSVAVFESYLPPHMPS